MDVASGCGEQEVGVASGSGWNLWVWLLGVVVRRYIYRFPHTTYPYSSCICSFLQQHPYLKKIFFPFFIIIYISYVRPFGPGWAPVNALRANVWSAA